MSSAVKQPFALILGDGVVLRGHVHDPQEKGPIGLFLHGFRSNIEGRKASALATHAAQHGRPWLAFDLRGHGGSGGDPAAPQISTLLTDLDAVFGRLKPRPVMLVGSSLGGWLAVRAAQRHPQQVRALLLVAPAFNFIQQYFGRLPEAEQERWARTGTHRFDDLYSEGSYVLDYTVVTDAYRHDVFAQRKPLQCPTIVVHGDRDVQVPLAQSRRFVDEVAPHAELIVVPGGDHRLASGIPALLQASDRLWAAAFDHLPRLDTPL